MLRGENIPQVTKETKFSDALAELNEKNVGAVLIMDDKNSVIGIITDGDIRRLVADNADLAELKLENIMTRNPKFIDADLLAADALSIMQRHEVTLLPVKDKTGGLVGVLHLHDLLGQGEFRLLV
jgi:arabinose-5-phosphate isomerase